MRILGFDTATRATAVALCDGTALRLEARDDPPAGVRPRHVTRLMPLIEEVLAEAGSSWRQIDRIAVGTGPGTFTGLRIGLATARALSRAREIPLVGVSTLQSLAMNADPGPDAPPLADTVLAVIDARRGEVFAGAWPARAGRDDERGPALLEPRAMGPERLAAEIGRCRTTVLAIGDGAIEFRAVLESSGALIPEDDSELHRVSAINHCRLAIGRQALAPDAVQPEYLRLPDAEISRRNR